MLLIFLLKNGQLYIRICMLNRSIQIILNKSLSVLSALLDLIRLDLRFLISTLTWAFGHLRTLFSKISTLHGNNARHIYVLIFTVLDYGFI